PHPRRQGDLVTARRRPFPSSVRAAVLAAATATAVACTPDFQSPRDVTDLRVLAIRQEALEPDGTSIFADAAVDFTSSRVQPVRIKMLVADPQPRRALAVGGQVCSPTDSGRCDQGQSLALPPINSSRPAVEQQPTFEP